MSTLSLKKYNPEALCMPSDSTVTTTDFIKQVLQPHPSETGFYSMADIVNIYELMNAVNDPNVLQTGKIELTDEQTSTLKDYVSKSQFPTCHADIYDFFKEIQSL